MTLCQLWVRFILPITTLWRGRAGVRTHHIPPGFLGALCHSDSQTWHWEIAASCYPPTPATQGGARQGREVVQLQQPLQHNYNSHCNAKHAASARQSSSSSTRCNFGLLRPSLPWCFPIWGPAAATAAAKALAAAGGKGSQNSKQQQEEKTAKIIIFYGFQKLR